MSRKPIEEFKTVNYHTPLCLLSDTRKLEEEFQEVLDALKNLMKGVDKLPPLTAIENLLTEQWKECIEVIEKATGEKWSNIKMKEWKELQIDNLPADILTGDYEFMFDDEIIGFVHRRDRANIFDNFIRYDGKYHYRKIWEEME